MPIKPTRIVIDSNIVISGFLFGGLPSRVLETVINGSVECFMSLQILDEIRDVLIRPKFGLSPEQALAFVEELHDICRLVSPTIRVAAVSADPADNKLLECAIEANVKVIVSGDSHLLDLKSWNGVRMLSAKEFLAEIEGE